MTADALCRVCGKGVAYYGRRGWHHIDDIDIELHYPVPDRGIPA